MDAAPFFLARALAAGLAAFAVRRASGRLCAFLSEPGVRAFLGGETPEAVAAGVVSVVFSVFLAGAASAGGASPALCCLAAGFYLHEAWGDAGRRLGGGGCWGAFRQGAGLVVLAVGPPRAAQAVLAAETHVGLVAAACLFRLRPGPKLRLALAAAAVVAAAPLARAGPLEPGVAAVLGLRAALDLYWLYCLARLPEGIEYPPGRA